MGPRRAIENVAAVGVTALPRGFLRTVGQTLMRLAEHFERPLWGLWHKTPLAAGLPQICEGETPIKGVDPAKHAGSLHRQKVILAANRVLRSERGTNLIVDEVFRHCCLRRDRTQTGINHRQAIRCLVDQFFHEQLNCEDFTAWVSIIPRRGMFLHRWTGEPVTTAQGSARLKQRGSIPHNRKATFPVLGLLSGLSLRQLHIKLPPNLKMKEAALYSAYIPRSFVVHLPALAHHYHEQWYFPASRYGQDGDRFIQAESLYVNRDSSLVSSPIISLCQVTEDKFVRHTCIEIDPHNGALVGIKCAQVPLWTFLLFDPNNHEMLWNAIDPRA